MSISIRDLLTFVGLFALLLAAMRLGGLVASATLFLFFFLVTLRTIVALSDSVERTTARGFVIPIFLYTALLACLGDTEFTGNSPVLFTSRVLVLLGKGAFIGSIKVQAWEYMSLGHAVVGTGLGAIGSLFAQSLTRPSSANDLEKQSG